MIKQLIFRKIGLGFILLFSTFIVNNSMANASFTTHRVVLDTIDKPIKVYLFLLDECRISQELMPDLNALYQTYQNDVAFVGVFPNIASKEENIETFKVDYHIQFPTRTDYFKQLCKEFDVEVLPEAVVVNFEGKVLYKGAINSLYVSRGRRIKTTPIPYLRNAISEAIINPKKVQKFHKAIGCAVNYSDKL